MSGKKQNSIFMNPLGKLRLIFIIKNKILWNSIKQAKQTDMIIYVKLLKMIHKRSKPQCSTRIYIVFVIIIELFKKVFLLRNLLKGNYYYCLMRAYFKLYSNLLVLMNLEFDNYQYYIKKYFTHTNTFKQTLRK